MSSVCVTREGVVWLTVSSVCVTREGPVCVSSVCVTCEGVVWLTVSSVCDQCVCYVTSVCGLSHYTSSHCVHITLRGNPVPVSGRHTDQEL